MVSHQCFRMNLYKYYYVLIDKRQFITIKTSFIRSQFIYTISFSFKQFFHRQYLLFFQKYYCYYFLTIYPEKDYVKHILTHKLHDLVKNYKKLMNNNKCQQIIINLFKT